MAEFLIASQVARLAGVESDTIRAAEKRGELHAVRAGHVRIFDRAEVDRYLRERAKRQTRRTTSFGIRQAKKTK